MRLARVVILLAAPGFVAAQDSLRLSALHTEALRLDPRQRQIGLQSRATDLRIAKIDAERRPSIALDGQAQYQSAVTKFPGQLPTAAFPVPPHDTYDAHLGAQQTLFDPTAAPRKAVERAQLLESQAQTNTSLFALRQEIDEAFFTAALIEQRVAEIETSITDLNARLRETVIRFNEGAALPGDTAAIAATLLQRRQDVLQMRADRSAALARLSELVGRGVDGALAVGDYSEAVASTLRALDTLKIRPEYAQFSAARDRLAKQTAVIAAAEKPRISAYGRVGYGRPGLDMLSRDFQSYWVAGLQVHWAPWTWGNTERDREIAGVQQEIVATNEAAFTRGLNRGIQQSVATIARLDSTLALDEQIISLRERIDRETRAKLREGVVTAAEYVDKSTDVLAARLARVQHRVELAHARATLLTTLGVEVP